MQHVILQKWPCNRFWRQSCFCGVPILIQYISLCCPSVERANGISKWACSGRGHQQYYASFLCIVTWQRGDETWPVMLAWTSTVMALPTISALTLVFDLYDRYSACCCQQIRFTANITDVATHLWARQTLAACRSWKKVLHVWGPCSETESTTLSQFKTRLQTITNDGTLIANMFHELGSFSKIKWRTGRGRHAL